MDSQTKVFRAHRALAFFYAFLGLGLMAALFLSPDDRVQVLVLPALVVLAGIVAIHSFTARACRQGKPGGRVASIVIALLMLLGFPIGTLIGIYLLANTWKPWTPASDARG